MISDGPTPKAAFALGEQKRNGASWLRRLGSGLGAAWRRVQVATRTHPTIETRVAALESAVASGVVSLSSAVHASARCRPGSRRQWKPTSGGSGSAYSTGTYLRRAHSMSSTVDGESGSFVPGVRSRFAVA